MLRLLGNETIQFNIQGKKSEPGLRKQLNRRKINYKIFSLKIHEYICHGRKSNLVEFQILLVESPIEVSTDKLGRKSNLGDLDIARESKI